MVHECARLVKIVYVTKVFAVEGKRRDEKEKRPVSPLGVFIQFLV